MSLDGTAAGRDYFSTVSLTARPGIASVIFCTHGGLCRHVFIVVLTFALVRVRQMTIVSRKLTI